MNYRHAYHAGNFADVVKHVVLARIVEYLKRKEKPFRVIDTHAGIGLYDLASEEAGKTGEWLDGIGRVADAQLSPEAGELLSPYLDAVRAVNAGAGIAHYPGSPMIVRHLLRRQDRLTAIELHPQGLLRGRHPDPRDRARRLAGARRTSSAQGKARPRARRSSLRGRRGIPAPDGRS
jgi:23S rRNA (adenine2030-N6)-methyltransferase